MEFPQRNIALSIKTSKIKKMVTRKSHRLPLLAMDGSGKHRAQCKRKEKTEQLSLLRFIFPG
jgi:hypothetical protein